MAVVVMGWCDGHVQLNMAAEMGAVDMARNVGSPIQSMYNGWGLVCCLHLDCMGETSAARWRATRQRSFGALDCRMDLLRFVVETRRGCNAGGYSTRLRCICVSWTKVEGDTGRRVVERWQLSLVREASTSVGAWVYVRVCR